MRRLRIRQYRFEPRNDGDDVYCANRITASMNPSWDAVTEKRRFRGSWRKPIEVVDKSRGNLSDSHTYWYQDQFFYDDIITNTDTILSGGYVVVLDTRRGIMEAIDNLVRLDWIDAFTKAVVLEIFVINTDVAITTDLRVFFRFEAGALFRDANVESYTLNSIFEGNWFDIFISVLFILLVLLECIHELTIMRHGIRFYLRRRRSYYELAKLTICICLIMTEILKKYKQDNFSEMDEESGKTNGRLHFHFDLDLPEKKYHQEKYGQEHVSYTEAQGFDLNTILNVLAPLVVFLDMMWILIKARDSPMMDMLIGLLVSTTGLVLEPLVMAIAFSCLGQIMLGRHTYTYHKFQLAFLTVIGTSVRGITRLEWEEASDTSKSGARMYYVLLFVMMTLIILNFFIVFMNESYSILSQLVKSKGTGNANDFLGMLTSSVLTRIWRRKHQDDEVVDDDVINTRIGPGGVRISNEATARIMSQ